MKQCLVYSFFILLASCTNPETAEPAMVKAAATNATRDIEMGDQRLAHAVKQMNEDFQKGNMEAWLRRYTEDAVFVFSCGDSLVGREAIAQYWKERRHRLMDTIEMSSEVLLPVSINTPTANQYKKGNWLLNWYQVHVRFQNKEELSFLVHVDHHFDSAGLIDRSIQYMDFVPIRNALQKNSSSR